MPHISAKKPAVKFRGDKRQSVASAAIGFIGWARSAHKSITLSLSPTYLSRNNKRFVLA
jgi:hypothetical protein